MALGLEVLLIGDDRGFSQVIRAQATLANKKALHAGVDDNAPVRALRGFFRWSQGGNNYPNTWGHVSFRARDHLMDSR